MNKSTRVIGNFILQNLEAIIWMSVIMYFAVLPVPVENHFTICPLKLAGFEYCPGCGLGRSIILLLHGKITESIMIHPLGIFALPLFVARIGIIFRKYFQYKKQITSTSL